MDKTRAFYKRCVKQLLTEYEGLQVEDARTALIFDGERMRYMVIWIGWEAYKRVHQCAVHIDICDDVVGNAEIVIQWNDTEDLLDEELVAMGVPREDIRLAMLPPEVQAFEARSYNRGAIPVPAG
jgi:hypothetical protein